MEKVTTQTVQAVIALKKDSVSLDQRLSALEAKGLNQGQCTNTQLQAMMIQLQRRNESTEQQILTLQRESVAMLNKIDHLTKTVADMRKDEDTKGGASSSAVQKHTRPTIHAPPTLAEQPTENPFLNAASAGPPDASSPFGAFPSSSSSSSSQAPLFSGASTGAATNDATSSPFNDFLPEDQSSPVVDIFATGSIQQQQQPPAMENIFEGLVESSSIGGGGGFDANNNTGASLDILRQQQSTMETTPPGAAANIPAGQTSSF